VAEKKYRPKSGNEGLAVEFPGTEGYVRIGPNDWPYAPRDAVEEAYLANLDEVTDRPPPKAPRSGSGASSGGANEGNGNEGGEG
jgi:hypothetical protein